MSFAGHTTMENRHGLCVLSEVQPAVGAPESAVAVDQMIELRNRSFTPKTGSADKGYHTEEFVTGLRTQKIVTHPARNDAQKTLHELLTLAHALSQAKRRSHLESGAHGETDDERPAGSGAGVNACRARDRANPRKRCGPRRN